MMDKQSGRFVFECDNCGEVLETETPEFSEAILILKEYEWKSKKIGSDWMHYCEKCHD